MFLNAINGISQFTERLIASRIKCSFFFFNFLAKAWYSVNLKRISPYALLITAATNYRNIDTIMKLLL